MFKALGSIPPLGNLTVAFGTPITGLLAPRSRAYTRLTRILYRCGSTAHTISVMIPLGRTTLASAVSATGTAPVLTADPGTGTVAGAMATNDWFAFELSDSTFFLAKATNVSTLTLTVAAFPAAAIAGAIVWFFGAPGDQASSQSNPTNHTTGIQLPATASVLNEWADEASGICKTANTYDPIMVYSDNATATGKFELISGCHTIN